MPAWLTQALLNSVETLYARIPRRQPSNAALADCRIVSHRGERDNQVVFENTFAAFDHLIEAGVWAIEFDIRWTRDLEPVVVHDPDLLRVFGRGERVRDLTLAQLRDYAPQIPSLAELLQRYDRRIHMMIELKAETYPSPALQQQRLQDLLADFEPAEDFHFLALDTTLFEHVAGFSTRCWLPVARSNIRQISDFALSRDCAGMAGPYALISGACLRRHREAGQRVGVGFPASRNVLYREINRGVSWIFSNHATRLQPMLNPE